MIEKQDQGQIRAIVKDVLRDEHLDSLPGLFSREHHKHRGTHNIKFSQLVDAPTYVDNRQFITIVNEDEDGMAFVDLLGTDHQIVVTKEEEAWTLSLHHQVHIYSDEEAPRVRITNLSGTLELDPVLQFALGPTDDVQFTQGVDDSDANKLKIANLSSLGTLAETQGAFGEILVFFHAYDNNLCYVDLADFATEGVLYNGVGGAGDGQFGVVSCITYDGTYLYVADNTNNRIQKFDGASGTYVAKCTCTRPWGVCYWEGYLYTMSQNTVGGHYRLYKIDAASMIISAYYDFDYGSADAEFSGPRGISTDGTNLYICDTNNYRIKKTGMTGIYVSKVGAAGTGDGQFGSTSPVDCEVDGSLLYVCDYTNKRVQIFNKSDLSFVAAVTMPAWDGVDAYPSSIAVNDTYFYVNCNGTVPHDGFMYKFDIATRTYQATYDTKVISSSEDTAWSAEIAKFASTGEKYGDLIVLHKDGSYLDLWPIVRFVDDIRLVEDGDLADGDYVGLKAPGAVTASYTITLPAAAPAVSGHFSIDASGTVSWGQALNTTDSPTFVKLTLSQAIGTAPMTITSTTVVTNLNADKADGYDFNQDVRNTASPTFVRLTLNQAIGTAPMTITSTTMVANLNADLLDGSHAAAFAAATHYHDSDYISIIAAPAANHFPYQTAGGELVDSGYDAGDFAAAGHSHALDDLSDVNAAAPGDGEVLTWDSGTSRWIAAAGGGGAFLDLTDVDEADYTGHAGQFVVVNGTEDGLIFTASSVAAHTLAGANHSDVDATGLSDDDILRYDSASGQWKCEALPAASNHDLLSATHADTLAAAVARGSVIIGNSTPKWAALAIGAAGTIFKSNGTDPAWAAQNTFKIDDFGTPDDNTDLNFTTSLHGLCPKGPAATNKDQWLCGDATWSFMHLFFGPKLQGRYYSGGMGSSTLTTASFGADNLRLVPFIVTKAHTYDRIGLGVTSGSGVSRYMRLGIYSTTYASGYPYPDALILDSGEITVSSNAFYEVNISQLLTPGLYWLAFLNSYAFTIRLVSAASCPINYLLGAPDGASGQDGYITVSQAYGALPNPFTAGAAPSTAGDYFPNIVLRVA